MRVFVTGATGFVGQEILRQLHAGGYGVRILTRNPASVAARKTGSNYAAEIQTGDVLDTAALADGLRGCAAAIHLVGIISEVGAQTFENLHTRATEAVVTAAKAAGVRRFLHMSALGTRSNAASRYHQTKWAAEEIVRRSGLDWTLFRPSLIFGPRDAFVNLFAGMARFSPMLPVMGRGRSQMQPVAVADVATCFVKALSEPSSSGQTLDLCGPDRLTMPEILRAILAATGRKRAIVRVPLPVARVQAAALEFVFAQLLRRAPPLNRDQLLMLEEANTGDPTPAERLFRLQFTAFREGIAKYLPAKKRQLH
jgi:uncharacterized protein YbjT (DUF2867 family)